MTRLTSRADAVRRRLKRRTNRLRVIGYNAKVGRSPFAVRGAVRQMIREHRPHVIVLQEAKAYAAHVKMRGWIVLAATGSSEAGHCVTMVRADRWVPRWVPIRLRQRWTGPKAGRPHEGRTFLAVDLGEDWRIVNTHRTRPGWSPGGKAFREEYDALCADAQRPGSLKRAWVSVGDQNIGTRPGRDRGDYTPWALAEQLGGSIIAASRGRVDSAVLRGAHGTARELGRYGSDHNAVLYTLTKEKP